MAADPDFMRSVHKRLNSGYPTPPPSFFLKSLPSFGNGAEDGRNSGDADMEIQRLQAGGVQVGDFIVHPDTTSPTSSTMSTPSADLGKFPSLPTLERLEKFRLALMPTEWWKPPPEFRSLSAVARLSKWRLEFLMHPGIGSNFEREHTSTEWCIKRSAKRDVYSTVRHHAVHLASLMSELGVKALEPAARTVDAIDLEAMRWRWESARGYDFPAPVLEWPRHAPTEVGKELSGILIAKLTSELPATTAASKKAAVAGQRAQRRPKIVTARRPVVTDRRAGTKNDDGEEQQRPLSQKKTKRYPQWEILRDEKEMVRRPGKGCALLPCATADKRKQFEIEDEGEDEEQRPLKAKRANQSGIEDTTETLCKTPRRAPLTVISNPPGKRCPQPVAPKKTPSRKPRSQPSQQQEEEQQQSKDKKCQGGRKKAGSDKDQLARSICYWINEEISDDKLDHSAFAHVPLPGTGTLIDTHELVADDQFKKKYLPKGKPEPVLTGDVDDLHAKEVALCRDWIFIDYNQYRCQKRRILLGHAMYQKLARLQEMSADWNITRAQQVCNCDGNPMSYLHRNFVQWGWMDTHSYMSDEYISDKVASYDRWAEERKAKGLLLHEAL